LTPDRLILPLFVAEGITEPRPVRSMPGVVQHTRDSLRRSVAEAAALGLRGVMLFGVPVDKDARGSGALDPDGILTLAIADAKAEAGSSLNVMSDVCLDEFTDHGHCGLVGSNGEILNDETVEIYAQMAVLHAEAGVDWVGPSGMMRGQVRAIRAALDASDHSGVRIMAYSSKFNSAFYGPFRDAVNSSLVGDRSAYQLDPVEVGESIERARIDEAEGADVVMVKPALGFLDIVSKVRDAVDVPVAAYNVSGEYAMVEAAAAQGWIDRDRTITESVNSIRRAGADIVLTYWAAELARKLS
jgi:porphobilinogen synthase